MLSRPAGAATLLWGVVLFVGSFLFTVREIVLGDSASAAFFGALTLAGGIFVWIAFRSIVVWTSPQGIAVGLLRVGWIPWSDIAGFEWDRNAIHAALDNGETRVVCGMATVLGTQAALDQAAKRLLHRLEQRCRTESNQT